MVHIQLYFQNAILQFVFFIHYEGFSSSPPSPEIYHHSPEPKITDMHLLYSRIFLPSFATPSHARKIENSALRTNRYQSLGQACQLWNIGGYAPDLSPSCTPTNHIAEEILYVLYRD